MDTVRSKLVKSSTSPSELDQQVARALVDLQSASNDLAVELLPLQIHGAREVDLRSINQRTSGKALIVVVPVPQLRAWRHIQTRVARELEKKFSAHAAVLFMARRRIKALPKRGQRLAQPRPYSRTLTAVHDAILEDIVFPTEIVGRRIRVKVDGSRLMKVLLDPKDQTALDSRVDTLATVYRKLTGKAVVFEFPVVAVDA